MSSNSSFSLPIPEEKKFKAFSDFLLSDVSSPTPDEPVHPINEWIQLNQKVFELSLELVGKNELDLWEHVAKLFLGMTPQQVEHFAYRHSVNMPNKKEKKVVHDSNDLKGKGLLSPGEPSKYGRDRDPIPAYRNERQYEVQGLDKNEEKKKVHDSNNVKGQEILPEPEPEKEKTSETKGTWPEEEKRLFLSGLEKYGPSKWKDISRHIGTRSSEQVRSYARRMRRKLNTGNQQTHCQPWPPAISKDGLCSYHGTSVWGSNVPPPTRRDLALLRPEHGLHNIYMVTFGALSATRHGI